MSVASLKKFLVGYWETNNHRNPPKNVNLFAGKNWAEELKTACTSETVRYIYELSMSSPIAQLVEQMTVNHWVAGSSPAWGASRISQLAPFHLLLIPPKSNLGAKQAHSEYH
jgi:hypothetical protein